MTAPDDARPDELVIELERPTTLLSLSALLGGLGAWFLLHRATTNDRGLVINGLIHLEPGGADVFYAIVGLLLAAFALVAVRALVGLVRKKHFRVVLGAEEITLPSSALVRSLEDRTVVIDEIVLVQAPARGAYPFLHLDTRRGRVSLNTRWLPPEWPADRLAQEIMRRVRARFDARDS